MSPRPIHRWKSFWFGVLVLLFHGWAWERSMKYDSTLNWGGSACSIETVNKRSSMVLRVFPDFSSYTGWIAEEGDAYIRGKWFPLPYLVMWDDFGIVIQVAHWFLILLFLVPWAAFLGRRWRRMNRIQDLGPEVST